MEAVNTKRPKLRAGCQAASATRAMASEATEKDSNLLVRGKKSIARPRPIMAPRCTRTPAASGQRPQSGRTRVITQARMYRPKAVNTARDSIG